MHVSLKDRRFTATTPLGGELLLKTLSAVEALARPFRLEAELLSSLGWVDGSKILGQPITFHMDVQGGVRTMSGIVTRFAEAGGFGRYARYLAVVEPWFSLLDLTTDCRVYQQKTVPEVVKDVFRDLGFADFEERLYGTYEPRDYVVQYRESAFNFVNRLLEEEGIYYFFRHEGDRHHLVLADSGSAHEQAVGYEEIPYYPPNASGRRERDHLTVFDRVREVQPGRLALTDFDFARPKAGLLAQTSAPNDHAHADLEVFEYPGGYTQLGAGEAYAKVRLERMNAAHERFEAAGNAAGIAAGNLFSLTGHPHPGYNREYLATATKFLLTVSGYETGGDLEERFELGLSAVDAQRPFRAPARTPKPLIQGVQSAIVVGPGGEEIWTDAYGRVKVQFHWDRLGKKDENSSCWVRVAHPWAGSAWGAVHLPRIGQEVLVEFLEGDPDRPVVTGRVYNGDNMPPYTLPDNKTQSGLKSRSTKGGGPDNFNELRFEDKKGAEQITLHAERDLQIVVENDESLSVGHDRTKDVKNNETVTVGVNRTETVGGDESISIKGARTEAVTKDETVTISAGRSHSIANDDTLSVGAAQKITVGAGQTVGIGAAQTLTVGAGQSITVGANQAVAVGASRSVDVGGQETVNVAVAQTINVGAAQSLTVGGAQSVSVGAARSVSVGGNETISVGGGRTASVGKNDTITVGKKLVVSAGDEITLKAGDASITLKKDGKIVIKGKDISLDGSGKITIKAGGDVVIKGSKIGNN